MGEPGADKQVERPASHLLLSPHPAVSPRPGAQELPESSVQSDQLLGRLFRFQNAGKWEFYQKGIREG